MSTKILYVSIWTATIAVAYLLGYLGQESSPIAQEFEEKPEKHSAKKPNFTAFKDKRVREVFGAGDSIGAKGKKEDAFSISDARISIGGLGPSYLPLTELQSGSGTVRPLTGKEIRETLGPALTSDNLVTRKA